MNLATTLKAILLILMISSYSCNNNNQNYKIKPTKYTHEGKTYEGDGYYKNGKLKLVIAYYDNRDTILIDSFLNGNLHGFSKEFYPNGKLKKIGKYNQNQKVGNWEHFHKTGELKTYQYWGSKENPMLYHKEYSKTGKLLKFNLPLEITSSSINNTFYIGDEYEIYIDLIHSEYDSVALLGLIDKNEKLGIVSDTLSIAGRRAKFKIKPQKIGIDTISGSITEYDMIEFLRTNKEPEYVPKQFFKYGIEVSNYR